MWFRRLAAKVQTVLQKDPFSGHVFVFRGKRGDLLKCLYWRDGGLCLLSNYHPGNTSLIRNGLGRLRMVRI